MRSWIKNPIRLLFTSPSGTQERLTWHLQGLTVSYIRPNSTSVLFVIRIYFSVFFFFFFFQPFLGIRRLLIRQPQAHLSAWPYCMWQLLDIINSSSRKSRLLFFYYVNFVIVIAQWKRTKKRGGGLLPHCCQQICGQWQNCKTGSECECVCSFFGGPCEKVEMCSPDSDPLPDWSWGPLWSL